MNRNPCPCRIDVYRSAHLDAAVGTRGAVRMFVDRSQGGADRDVRAREHQRRDVERTRHRAGPEDLDADIGAGISRPHGWRTSNNRTASTTSRRHAWADTPARMLKPLLTRQMTNCGLFHYVFSDSAGVEETLRLDSSVVEFAQFFSEDVERGSRVDPLRSDRRRASHDARQPDDFDTEAAATREPYAGVVAANRAVQRALDQLVTKLRGPVTSLRSTNP